MFLVRIHWLILLCALVTICGTAQEPIFIIRVGQLLDGKGGVQRNTNIVVQGAKIIKIGDAAEMIRKRIFFFSFSLRHLCDPSASLR